MINKLQKNIVFQKRFISALLGISILSSGSVLGISPEVKSNKDSVGSSASSKYKKPLIIAGATIGGAILTLLGTRALSSVCIFPGIIKNPRRLPSICNIDNLNLYNDKNTDGEIISATRKFIQIDDLKGCSHKLNNPISNKLSDKCVIVFGPNADACPNMIHSFPLEALLKQGATVVTVDYRGFGHSYLSSRALKISQNTIYKDGETIYRYVLENLKYDPQDVIIFGFSLGGSVASHVADYSSKRNETLAGLILASPINSLYGIASDMTCKPLAAVARLITMSELNTEENLRGMTNKDIPVFLCSGDRSGKEEDFLSLEKTLIDQKLKELGFTDISINIAKNCGHNDLDKMFESDGSDKPESTTKFNEYVNNKLKNS